MEISCALRKRMIILSILNIIWSWLFEGGLAWKGGGGSARGM